jgi:hypothetical protein
VATPPEHRVCATASVQKRTHPQCLRNGTQARTECTPLGGAGSTRTALQGAAQPGGSAGGTRITATELRNVHAVPGGEDMRGGGGGPRPPPSRLCGTTGQSTPVAGTVRWPPRPGSLAVELAPAQGVRQAPPEGCRAPARRPRPQPQGLPGPAGTAALTLHRPAPTAAPAAGTNARTPARTQQSGDARNKVVMMRATRW